MRLLATIQLVVGAAILGAGVWTRDAAGRGLMLAGGINMAAGAYVLFGDVSTALRYGILAAFALLLIVTLATVTPATWRVVRLEALLAGVLVAGIVVFETAPRIPPGGHIALLVVIGASGILMLVLPMLRMLKWMRRDPVR